MKTLFAIILAGALSLIALPIQAQTEETTTEKASDTATTEKAEKTEKTEKTDKAADTKAKTKKKEKAAKPAKEATTTSAASSTTDEQKARNLVMAKYPGAKVIMATQETVKGNQVWVITFQRTGSNLSEKVMVDAAGKVSRM